MRYVLKIKSCYNVEDAKEVHLNSQVSVQVSVDKVFINKYKTQKGSCHLPTQWLVVDQPVVGTKAALIGCGDGDAVRSIAALVEVMLMMMMMMRESSSEEMKKRCIFW